MGNRRITHVAVRYKDKVYSLPAPNRHHDVIRLIDEEDVQGIQGFLTDKGKFLNRTNALSVALKAGQLKDPAKLGQLYSEDIW